MCITGCECDNVGHGRRVLIKNKLVIGLPLIAPTHEKAANTQRKGALGRVNAHINEVVILLDEGMCATHTKIPIIERGIHIRWLAYRDNFFAGGIRHVVPVHQPDLVNECSFDFDAAIDGCRTVIVETLDFGDVSEFWWERFGTISPHGKRRLKDGYSQFIQLPRIRDSMHNTKITPGCDDVYHAQITGNIQLSGIVTPPTP